MKKFISLVLVVLLAVSTLAGCGSSNTSGNNSSGASSADSTVASAPAESTAAPAEKAKLTIWFYWENKDQQSILAGLCDQYNKSQDAAEISSQYIPFADFKKQLSIGMAAGKVPDLTLIDNPDLPSYASMGLFADVTDKIKAIPGYDQYFDGPVKSCTLDGKVYGLPFGSNDIALYYNLDMFSKAGIAQAPTTWDELRADAKKLSGNGVYGLGVSGVNTEEGTFQFMPWLLSAGATPFKVDGPEGIKAFTFVSDLVKDGSMPKDVMNWVQSDVNKQFEAGNLAMMINGPWQLPSLAKDTPDLKFGVALIPKDQQYASVLGGEDWGVVNGKNVDAAIDFLKFVVSPDLLKDYCNKFGYFPSRKDMASDPVFTSDPIKKVFVDEMQYASPRGPSAQWPQLSLAISTALQEVITGSKTPEAAAKDAQAKIDGIGK